MEGDPKLYMLLLGCKPPGRHTEQHDIFFGIGNSMVDLKPHIQHFWKGAGTIHIDGWRLVTNVDGYAVKAVAKAEVVNKVAEPQLFFINLGGYKQNELEEYHYKMLVAAEDKGAAIKTSMKTAFYKHTGFAGATSHVDDKYGVDVDDIFAINDILSPAFKDQFSVQVSQTIDTELRVDELHLGYLKWNNIV